MNRLLEFVFEYVWPINWIMAAYGHYRVAKAHDDIRHGRPGTGVYEHRPDEEKQ